VIDLDFYPRAGSLQRPVYEMKLSLAAYDSKPASASFRHHGKIGCQTNNRWLTIRPRSFVFK
jgi:hypothetical protein